MQVLVKDVVFVPILLPACKPEGALEALARLRASSRELSSELAPHSDRVFFSAFSILCRKSRKRNAT
jgi:hypothetical protein